MNWIHEQYKVDSLDCFVCFSNRSCRVFFLPAPTDRPKKRLRRRSKNGGSGSATLSKVTCKAVRFLCKKPVVKVLNVTLVWYVSFSSPSPWLPYIWAVILTILTKRCMMTYISQHCFFLQKRLNSRKMAGPGLFHLTLRKSRLLLAREVIRQQKNHQL